MEFEKILQEVQKISDETFILAKDGKFKESSERLEKALFKMLKLIHMQPSQDKNIIKNELKKISLKFNILKRYFELVWQIENEANRISLKDISAGSVCNRKI